MKPIQFAKLSDICRIESGGTPSSSDPSYWDGNIPWVTLVDVRNKYVETTTRGISLSGLKNSSATVLPVGTVLFSSRATIGIVSIAKIELATNQGFKNFICDENKLIPEYLYYFLNYEAKRIEASCPGTTYKEISKSKIGKYTISLPSLDDQKRIVNILDAADELRQKRRQAIGLLDDYLKSVFLEMFGDPVKNSKGWQRMPLSSILARIESGRSPVCHDRKAGLGERGVLKLGSVTKCVYDPGENKALPESEKWNPNIEIKAGDILFSRKNTRDLIAACVYVWLTPSHLMMSDLIFRLVLNESNMVNPVFLQALLIFPSKRKEIQNLASGAAGSMPNISKAKLLNQMIEVPPISVQNEFAEIVRKCQYLREKMIAQSEEWGNNFQALMQKAFKGEL